MTNSLANTSPSERTQLAAPTLSGEIREAIARWLEQRKMASTPRRILDALADVAGEQIAAIPIEPAQIEALNYLMDKTIIARRDANRQRIGGVLVELVVKQ